MMKTADCCELEKGISIECGDIALELGFDRQNGLVLRKFENRAPSRQVSYFTSPQGIMPVVGAGGYTLLSFSAEKRVERGKEISVLLASVADDTLQYDFSMMLYPEFSVLQYGFLMVSTAKETLPLKLRPAAFTVETDDPKDLYILSCFKGGKASYDHGMRCDVPLGSGWSPARVGFDSSMTGDYMPLVLFRRQEEPCDAFMLAVDYIADWSFYAYRNPARQRPELFHFGFSAEKFEQNVIGAGESLHSPRITLCVYDRDDDNLMEKLYNWQYTYQWDLINRDYFAKTRCLNRWVGSSRNLHEQFAHCLTSDAQFALHCTKLGYDILWNDAGWSACEEWPENGYASVFNNNYEGPDFSLLRDSICFRDVLPLTLLAAALLPKRMPPHCSIKIGTNPEHFSRSAHFLQSHIDSLLRYSSKIPR